MTNSSHDDVIKWKHFPRCGSFGRWIHRWPVNSPYKVQWRGALMGFFICASINAWVNNREAGDLRRWFETLMPPIYDSIRTASSSEPLKLAELSLLFINTDSLLTGDYRPGNSSPPGQNGRHVADNIFRYIVVNEKFCILIKMSLNFVPKGTIDNNLALV